ncbi:SusC/RagA family TonB-linked outer membrane protein [Marinifilum sp.]|uniref:SusC/RagA family TonB-linked outer membrane protein n=1 Tax=Marinifilum sp. TaxID=2033137 RepID=UPI003BA88096
MKKNDYWRIPIRFGIRNKWLLAMKIYLMLMLACNLSLSASVLSQTRVALSVKNASFIELIQEIESKTDLGFIYNQNDIKNIDEISIDTHDITVEEVLNAALENSGLEYEIDRDIIIIRPAQNVPTVKEQQEKKAIRGKVTDKNGVPLPGVSVVIKGSTIGAATDINGNYALKFDGDNVVLVFSFVGMLPQEIKYTGQVFQNVSLLADTETMDEVVVTGYQSISAERATGSFENVKVEKLLEQKTTANALDILEGEVPGLLYENMGDGNPSRISLRGLSNFNMSDGAVNSHAPLIVVDGFPISGISGGADANGDDFTSLIEKINPADIENISVLKDAAAASIWGARAANGVIVITTKKGKKSDKPQISFNSSFSIREKPNYSDAYVASVNDHLELDEWWAAEGGIRDEDRRSNSRVNSEGIQAYYDYANGNISDADFNTTINGLKQNYYIKEYSDLFLRNYTQQQYNLSISQGNDKYQYRVGLNYQDQKNLNKGDGNQNYGALINLSTELMKGVKFSTKIGFSKRDIQNNGINNIQSYSPYARILDDNGDYITMPHLVHPRIKDEVYQELEPYLPFDWDYNLKREFDNQDNSTEVRNTDFQARLDIDIVKGLKAELSYDYQYGRNKTRMYRNEEIWEVRNEIIGNAFYVEDPNSGEYVPDGTFIIPPGGGTLDRNSYASWTDSYRGMLNYTGYLDANSEHFVTAIVGIEYRDEKYDGQTDETLYNYNPQALRYTDIYSVPYEFDPRQTWDGSGIYRITNNARVDRDHDRYLSNYANVGYTFKDKYTLTGSWRLDDSNLFGSSPKYRNVPLWSTGLKWRLAEEDFMNVSFLNRLDLRVSYGTGGRINRDASPFLTASLIADTRTQVPTAEIKDYPNAELRWETTATLNAGFDFVMFNNRLSGSFEYYRRYTSDVLGSVAVNRTYGVEDVRLNYAEISNKGFDLSLNYRILQNSSVNWDMGVMVNHNVNKVERFDGTETVESYTSVSPVEGYGLSEVFAYRWAGLSPEDGTVQVYNENDEIIGWDDDALPTKDGLQYMGQMTPKFFGNYRNRVSYKGLNLDVLLTYKFGHKFKRSTFVSGSYNRVAHVDAEKRWRQPGDEAFTDVPSNTIGGKTSVYLRDGSQMYEDASHIRIQSIGLSYNLNSKLLANTFVKGVTLGVNGRNLGLLWKATDKDIDPDFGNGVFTYKNRATYSMNLKVNF